MCRHKLIRSLKITIPGACSCPGAKGELEGQVLTMALLGFMTLVWYLSSSAPFNDVGPLSVFLAIYCR